MGGVFDMVDYMINGAPSSSPAPPPEAPTADNSAKELDEAARKQAANLARGRSATMLTGGAGLNNLGTSSRVLLGQ